MHVIGPTIKDGAIVEPAARFYAKKAFDLSIHPIYVNGRPVVDVVRIGRYLFLMESLGLEELLF